MAEALRIERLGATLGTRKVLSDVNVEAPFGEVTAIIGPNGAGKSTLLRAVAGLVPHEGTVVMNGITLSSLLPHERAKALSFVPQSSLLASAISVRDVVLQGRYAHRGFFARVSPQDRKAVDEAMLETDVTRFAERSFTELSFGEQRRVLIARSLATGARTILLDEPTAALDIEHSLRLYELLNRLAAQQRCIVVVLHDLDDVRAYAHRAVMLKDGRVVAQGQSRSIVDKTHVRELYGVELVEGGGLGFRLPEDAR